MNVLLALAETMHDESDLCNANYYLPFDQCELREADIEDACKVLKSLKRLGVILVADPAGTIPMTAYGDVWRSPIEVTP